jgi:NADH-quinone oxidoreductase subunit N
MTIILQAFNSEILLILFILIQLLSNSYIINDLKNNYPVLEKEVFSQTLFILICIFFILLNSKTEGFFSTYIFFSNSSSRLLKILTTLSSIFILIPLIKCFRLQKLNFFEYFSFYLFSILSSYLLICACDLISVYLVIEMQALAFYILSSFKRDSAFSTEAGLKYFISGSFMSGIFLLGGSFVYGSLGTLNLHHVYLLAFCPLESVELELFLLVGVLLLVISLLFKLSVAPFHFWSPDVYDGAPLGSTIIFSIIPKFALFNFLIKILCVFSVFTFQLSLLMLFCGILTTFFGAFFAIQQKKIKRFVIYSSISQVGFLITTLSDTNLENLTAVYFFLIIYIITSILVWDHISFFYLFRNISEKFLNKKSKPFFISNLSNLYRINKLWAFSFLIIIFSIAGIPPSSGFFSKFMIIFSLINSNQLIGAISLIIISIISAFYYLRVLKIIFFEKKSKFFKKAFQFTVYPSPYSSSNYLMISTLLFLLLFFFINPTLLMYLCEYIVLKSIFF